VAGFFFRAKGAITGGVRTVLYRRYGGPEVLELADTPRPEAGPGQLLVRVEATSVNPIDWKRASGTLRLLMPAKLPLVPGYDVAGTVAALGAGVTGFALGDRVHARLADSRGGASAEYAVAGVDVATKLPQRMTMLEAAALPLAGMAALQGLRDVGGLEATGSTKRVLVVGASGGVGHVAVQVARASGATVVGVCSTRNVALVERLGARAVDYTKPDAFAGLAPFDLVLDCVAAEAGRWLPHVAPGGCYASTVPTPGLFARAALNAFSAKKVRAVMLHSRARDLATLDALFEAGRLEVVVDSQFPLEQLARAWERSLSGRACGKIVVTVQAPHA
jgi:NADPH:quinone reductase-like Zn-dependent oxidoreductase